MSVSRGVHFMVARSPVASQNSIEQVKTVLHAASLVTEHYSIFNYVSKCNWLIFVRDRKVMFFKLFSDGFLLISVQWYNSDYLSSLLNSLKLYLGNLGHINIFVSSNGTLWPCLSLVSIRTTRHILLCYVLQNVFVYEPEVFWSYIDWNVFISYRIYRVYYAKHPIITVNVIIVCIDCCQ